MNVSLIITTFKRTHLLRHGLTSILAHYPTKVDKFEILVMDEGPKTDQVEDLCKSFDLPIKYIFTGNNGQQWRIPGFAINIAAKRAIGDILILSCAEMYHVDNVIDSLSTKVEADRKTLAVADTYDDKNILLPELEKGNKDLKTLSSLLRMDNWFFPFLMAIDKNEFISIGGYDEDFTAIGCDDNDIVDRLKNNGCHVERVSEKAVHLYHKRLTYGHAQSNKALFEQRRGTIARNEGREWGVLK